MLKALLQVLMSRIQIAMRPTFAAYKHPECGYNRTRMRGFDRALDAIWQLVEEALLVRGEVRERVSRFQQERAHATAMEAGRRAATETARVHVRRMPVVEETKPNLLAFILGARPERRLVDPEVEQRIAVARALEAARAIVDRAPARTIERRPGFAELIREIELAIEAVERDFPDVLAYFNETGAGTIEDQIASERGQAGDDHLSRLERYTLVQMRLSGIHSRCRDLIELRLKLVLLKHQREELGDFLRRVEGVQPVLAVA